MGGSRAQTLLLFTLGCGAGSAQRSDPVAIHDYAVESVRPEADGGVWVTYSVDGERRTVRRAGDGWAPVVIEELVPPDLGALPNTPGWRLRVVQRSDREYVAVMDGQIEVSAVEVWWLGGVSSAEMLVGGPSDRGLARGWLTHCADGEPSYCEGIGFVVDAAGSIRLRCAIPPGMADEGPSVIAHWGDFLLGGFMYDNTPFVASLEGPAHSGGATMWPLLDLPASELHRELLAISVVPYRLVFTDAPPELAAGSYVRVTEGSGRNAWRDVAPPRRVVGRAVATDTASGFVLATATRAGIEVVELAEREWVPYGPLVTE